MDTRHRERPTLDTQRFLRALRALAEPSRLRVVVLLARGELTVSELTEVLGQSQPGVSRHLRILVEAELLERFQEGSWAFYRLSDRAGCAALRDALLERLPADDPQFELDQERLTALRQRHLERAGAYFDRIASQWDEVRRLHVEEHEVEAAMLRATDGIANAELLDLGTGTGRILEVFAPRISRGMGVDLSRDMLAAARAKLAAARLKNCQLRHGDICRLDLPAGAVDIVTIHHVLHFLDDPRRALAEAARCLRPNGRLVVVDFAPHGHEFLRTQHAHRRLGFHQDEVLGWLAELGLETASVEHLRPIDDSESLTISLWTARQRDDAPDHRRLRAA